MRSKSQTIVFKVYLVIVIVINLLTILLFTFRYLQFVLVTRLYNSYNCFPLRCFTDP